MQMLANLTSEFPGGNYLLWDANSLLVRIQIDRKDSKSSAGCLAYCVWQLNEDTSMELIFLEWLEKTPQLVKFGSFPATATATANRSQQLRSMVCLVLRHPHHV
jgi:hypothetical protein